MNGTTGMPTRRRLTDKVALVTGSTSGIGLAIAKALAAEGAVVVTNSRRLIQAPVVDVSGREMLHVACDVSREDDVADMLATVERSYSRLDVVVNCAGATVFVPHHDLAAITSRDWERILGVNVVGAWNTVRAAEKLLRASGGAVINLTSMAGIRPAGSSIPYAASKAALNHLTALLARALGPAIRVNAVAPGFIDTPWTADYSDRRRQVEAEAPLRRVGTPAEVADVCLALICAEYVTGQIVTVDGGLSLL